MELYFFLLLIPLCYSNWDSEWFGPIKDTYSREQSRNVPEGVHVKLLGKDGLRVPTVNEGNQEDGLKNRDTSYRVASGESMSSSLTQKLRETLHSAKILAETLKRQIIFIASREKLLKDIIVTGRSGVTVLTVQLLSKLPRTYIIRDGFWTLCNGMVQYPTSGHGSSGLFTAPRCIGQEVSSRQDPCVFNSIVKYETIPRQRGIIYSEEDYLCLKGNFNETLEQYLSVPRHVVNETCRNGTVRKLADNSLQCGLRVLSEYTYYPHTSAINSYLPVEYCSESDGACKLMVAWHISNTSIENFEFIKNDKAFKKFFMDLDARST